MSQKSDENIKKMINIKLSISTRRIEMHIHSHSTNSFKIGIF